MRVRWISAQQVADAQLGFDVERLGHLPTGEDRDQQRTLQARATRAYNRYVRAYIEWKEATDGE